MFRKYSRGHCIFTPVQSRALSEIEKNIIPLKTMNLGMIIYSRDAETIWNAFRFANFSLKEGDSVGVFLLAKGVEYETLDDESYTIKEQARIFLENNGKIFACGTCLKSRESEGSQTCPLSTMKDLYTLMKTSDKIISF